MKKDIAIFAIGAVFIVGLFFKAREDHRAFMEEQHRYILGFHALNEMESGGRARLGTFTESRLSVVALRRWAVDHGEKRASLWTLRPIVFRNTPRRFNGPG